MASIKSVHPVIMSSNVEKKMTFLSSLGFEVAFKDDEEHPKYAGMARNAVEVHIQWDDLSDLPRDLFGRRSDSSSIMLMNWLKRYGTVGYQFYTVQES